MNYALRAALKENASAKQDKAARMATEILNLYLINMQFYPQYFLNLRNLCLFLGLRGLNLSFVKFKPMKARRDTKFRLDFLGLNLKINIFVSHS